MKDADFFISAAGENRELADPRACVIKARLRDQIRDDHMLIEVEPPVIGQPYGLGDRNILCLVLSPFYVGSRFFPVSEWPCHVYIARLLDESVTKTLAFTRDQVQVIAWGTIFPSLDQAKAHAEMFR